MNENPIIDITTTVSFVEKESDVEKNRYIFAYTITITNKGKRVVQLLQRHWVLTNANGKVQEVHGEGVVGLTPTLQPNESFRYTSSALIESAVGTMQGYYTFIDHKGKTFDVPIERFTLSIPRTLH
jgi:ApaG protein